MILVDTTELTRPTQRNLHAAWCELGNEQVLATPTVADELVPLSVESIWSGKPSLAEMALEEDRGTISKVRKSELHRQVWWARMWTDTGSPYRIVGLSQDQEELVSELQKEIDARCFPMVETEEEIADLTDARIVCETNGAPLPRGS